MSQLNQNLAKLLRSDFTNGKYLSKIMSEEGKPMQAYQATYNINPKFSPEMVSRLRDLREWKEFVSLVNQVDSGGVENAIPLANQVDSEG
jgi:hypothetical protein